MAPPAILPASFKVIPKFSNSQAHRKSTHQDDCMKPVSGVSSRNASQAFQESRGGACGRTNAEFNASQGSGEEEVIAVGWESLIFKWRKLARLRTELRAR